MKKTIFHFLAILTLIGTLSSCAASRGGGGHERCPAYGDASGQDDGSNVSERHDLFEVRV